MDLIRAPLLGDDEPLVRGNSAIQVGDGAMPAIDVISRLSALASVGLMLPNELAVQMYRDHEDPIDRRADGAAWLGLCGRVA